MKPLVCFACACLFLLSARVGAGQTYQGGIRGQVRDQQGVIPGVEVTLINEAMNTGRTIVTNEVGEFAFANVLPGSLLDQGRADRLQDRGAQGRHGRDAAAPRDGLHAAGRRALGADHRRRRARRSSNGMTPTVATSLDQEFPARRCRSSDATRSSRRSRRRT